MEHTPVIINDYQHKPGGSCIVTALSGMYRHNGLDFGPEQIIGLGSGLQFAYGYNPFEKNYRIEFISSQLFYSLLSNTGTYGEEFEFSDQEKSLTRVFELIDSNMPVPVMMDPLYCEGLMKRTSKEFIKYIPSHMMVVYGYDLSSGQIFLYDSPQFNPISMKINDFVKARCSGPTLPTNKHMEFYFPETIFPYHMSVKLAIRKVISVYKYSEKHLAHKSGFQAIDRFTGNVKNWREIFTDAEIIDNARLFMMGVTNGHATKGAFRTQYSIFLSEASERIDSNGFYQSSQIYYDLGKLWIEFQKCLNILIKDPGTHEIWKDKSSFYQLLDEINEKEKLAINVLEKELISN
ncbi:MAG: BtrH N-terminal domain-containing protein [Chryseobacterium sp.]|uniref:DUF4872 domain-containing protein n=1 Tax=Chryseobacterium sp. TaxID=1871047 RepID=UPI0025BDF857|nr:DUF4872 domain-containing protein [Chryseobacterium sp.]MCJ7934773.1 BtrH N-terminal domain-containing protein [Chryseobacterium sp.]